MIAGQERLTGPSDIGTSQELHEVSQLRKIAMWILKGTTHSSHSFTLSRCATGIELIWTGGFLRSWSTKTISKFFNPNCTRSRCTISTSDKVITVNGNSEIWIRQLVVGSRATIDLWGTPLKPSSRKGTSTSSSNCCAWAAVSIRRAKSWNSLSSSALRLRSSCSCSISSSSPYLARRFLPPVSSKDISATSL